MMPNRELPRQQQPSQELPNRPPEQYLSGTPTGARSLDWVRSADQMPLSNRAVGPSVETVQPWELELNRPQPSGPNDPWSILAHTAFDKVKAQEKSKREATAPQLPSNEIVSPAKKAKAGGTDSNPLREASDQFSQSISGKEALSEREVTILPEQPSSEIPPSTQKENQYTTDKKHLITKKSIYDSLDHEIITSLNDPEKKIHMKEFFISTMHIRYGNKVSILSVDEPLGNCHAYTFTRDKGGRLSGDDVAVILADNGYKLIAIANEISEAPQKEDVVIYHVEDPQDSTQYITHSGVFSRTEGEEFYVASKAGPYDITEHLISYNKYYGEWTIYHTDRPNGRFIDSNSISELVGLL